MASATISRGTGRRGRKTASRGAEKPATTTFSRDRVQTASRSTLRGGRATALSFDIPMITARKRKT